MKLKCDQRLSNLAFKFNLRRFTQEVDYLVVSPLDEVMWLFNVRGNDADCNPVTISYGLVGKETATLYVDQVKVTDAVRQHLDEAGVVVKPYEECVGDMKAGAYTRPLFSST